MVSIRRRRAPCAGSGQPPPRTDRGRSRGRGHESPQRPSRYRRRPPPMRRGARAPPVRDLVATELLGVLPAAAGGEAHEHHLEAVQVGPAPAVAAKRVCHHRAWDERLHRLPDSRLHLGIQGTHDVSRPPSVVGLVCTRHQSRDSSTAGGWSAFGEETRGQRLFHLSARPLVLAYKELAESDGTPDGARTLIVGGHITEPHLQAGKPPVALGGDRGGPASRRPRPARRDLRPCCRASGLDEDRSGGPRPQDPHPRLLRPARRRDPLPCKGGVRRLDAAGTRGRAVS